MIESAVRFGDGNRLIGIHCLPENAQMGRNLPAVIFLNAGLLHRVGPFRFYVDLARIFCSMGYSSFRFDLSGIGDSEANDGSEGYEKNAIKDAKAAMDFVQAKSNISTFILLGLCAGADNAHRIAGVDSRVVGAVFLDGYGFPTPWFKVRDYAPGLLKPHKWLKYLKKYLGGTVTPSVNTDITVFERLWPTRETAMHELSQLVQRGVELIFIYSGGVPVYYNYRNQFKDMFKPVDFRGKLKLEYFKHANHTYTVLEQREKLFKCICSWVSDKFGKGSHA
jgi:hypothetical protein